MQPNHKSKAVCIRRDAQAQLDGETEGMSSSDRDTYINRLVLEVAERLGFKEVCHPLGRGRDIGSEDARRAG